MDMKLLFGAMALVCLALEPVAGHAQSKGRSANLDTFMQQWDPDHDGTLSLDEVKKAADARFDALDTDHEGTLDKKELRGVLSLHRMSSKPTRTKTGRWIRLNTKPSPRIVSRPPIPITTARLIKRNSAARPVKH
jgi:Ca2+-binding EF-hand superfamily protein